MDQILITDDFTKWISTLALQLVLNFWEILEHFLLLFAGWQQRHDREWHQQARHVQGGYGSRPAFLFLFLNLEAIKAVVGAGLNCCSVNPFDSTHLNTYCLKPYMSLPRVAALSPSSFCHLALVSSLCLFLLFLVTVSYFLFLSLFFCVCFFLPTLPPH